MSVRPRAVAFGTLAVGAVVALDPGGLAPFGPAKWWVVSTAAFVVVALSLRHGTTRCHRPSWWAWVMLLGLLTMSALVNGDVKVAMFGHPDRHLGVLTWLLLFAMFCAGQQLADDVSLLVRASALAAGAVGVYASWEIVFGPPIEVASVTRRLLGPFGSAAFLGSACCLFGPIALGMAFDRSEDRRWRWVSGIAAVLVTTAIVGAGTRAAWVGAAAAAMVAAAARRPSRGAVLWCAGCLAVAIAMVTPRLGDVSSRNGSDGSRLDEWRVAARVIEHHPLTGVGPEGYRIAVADGIDQAYERAHRRDTVLPDRAHSGPLDVALIGGLGSALLYVGLLGFVFLRAWRLMRRAQRAAIAGIGATVIAYGVQQLLLFPLAELDPIWWLFGGLAVVLTSVSEPIERRRTVLPVVAAAAAAIMFVIGALDVAADRLARTALRSSDHDVAVDAAVRATSLRPDNMRYRLVAAEARLDRGTLADVDGAIAESRQATQWSSRDPFATDELATALLQRAVVTGAPADVAAALAQWQRLVDRDPLRARWQMQLGRTAALAGDVGRARQAWKIADALGEPGAAGLIEALDASP